MRYDDNLAYELELSENTARVEKKVQEHKRQAKARAKAKAAQLRKTVSVCAIAIALCAGFMISRNVTAYEKINETENLQNDLDDLKEYSIQKAFELEQSTDYDEIREWAKANGMVDPEPWQTVYVNIKQDDVTEVKAKEVEKFSLLDIFR